MNKKEFDIEILSHNSSTFMKVEWLEVASPTGSFVIAPGHAPIISLLKSGSSISYFKDGHIEQTAPIDGGIVHIQNNKPVLILLWN